MIYSLRGTLVHKEQGLAVVECGGVGYGCRTTYSTLSKLTLNEEVYLYTYFAVREDAAELFGFADKQELSCFRQLISVTGVGPKAALAILSDTSPEQFAITVASGDYKVFTKTKGVGPKLAQRIILELKDKITKEQLTVSGYDSAAAVLPSAGNAAEAISALAVLGYTQTEAAQAVAKLDSSLPAEELIKAALRSMASSLR